MKMYWKESAINNVSNLLWVVTCILNATLCIRILNFDSLVCLFKTVTTNFYIATVDWGRLYSCSLYARICSVAIIFVLWWWYHCMSKLHWLEPPSCFWPIPIYCNPIINMHTQEPFTSASCTFTCTGRLFSTSLLASASASASGSATATASATALASAPYEWIK